MDRDTEIIVDLIENSTVFHYIDTLPMPIMHDGFFEIEKYLLKYHLHDIAKKVSRIIIKLIHYYPAKIYQNEYVPKMRACISSKDLRSAPLEKIEKMIYDAIISNRFSISILLGNGPYTFITTKEYILFVYIYNASGELLELLKMLVQSEGLFLKQRKNW